MPQVQKKLLGLLQQLRKPERIFMKDFYNWTMSNPPVISIRTIEGWLKLDRKAHDGNVDRLTRFFCESADYAVSLHRDFWFSDDEKAAPSLISFDHDEKRVDKFAEDFLPIHHQAAKALCGHYLLYRFSFTNSGLVTVDPMIIYPTGADDDDQYQLNVISRQPSIYNEDYDVFSGHLRTVGKLYWISLFFGHPLERRVQNIYFPTRAGAVAVRWGIASGTSAKFETPVAARALLEKQAHGLNGDALDPHTFSWPIPPRTIPSAEIDSNYLSRLVNNLDDGQHLLMVDHDFD